MSVADQILWLAGGVELLMTHDPLYPLGAVYASYWQSENAMGQWSTKPLNCHHQKQSLNSYRKKCTLVSRVPKKFSQYSILQ